VSEYKTILIRRITVLQVLCILAVVLFWHILHERELETIELPSGDKIVIVWHPSSRILCATAGAGGLRYRIYSGDIRQSGPLTRDLHYDLMIDVKLTHEIQGDRQVRVEDGRSWPHSWLFSGKPTGEYEVVDLGVEQKP